MIRSHFGSSRGAGGQRFRLASPENRLAMQTATEQAARCQECENRERVFQLTQRQLQQVTWRMQPAMAEQAHRDLVSQNDRRLAVAMQTTAEQAARDLALAHRDLALAHDRLASIAARGVHRVHS